MPDTGKKMARLVAEDSGHKTSPEVMGFKAWSPLMEWQEADRNGLQFARKDAHWESEQGLGTHSCSSKCVQFNPRLNLQAGRAACTHRMVPHGWVLQGAVARLWVSYSTRGLV